MTCYARQIKKLRDAAETFKGKSMNWPCDERHRTSGGNRCLDLAASPSILKTFPGGEL